MLGTLHSKAASLLPAVPGEQFPLPPTRPALALCSVPPPMNLCVMNAVPPHISPTPVVTCTDNQPLFPSALHSEPSVPSCDVVLAPLMGLKPDFPYSELIVWEVAIYLPS